MIFNICNTYQPLSKCCHLPLQALLLLYDCHPFPGSFFQVVTLLANPLSQLPPLQSIY